MSADDLRRCLRDVTALASLPSVWRGAPPRRIVETLADALFTALRAEVVYVTANAHAGAPIEAVRVATGQSSTVDERRAASIVAALRAWLERGSPADAIELEGRRVRLLWSAADFDGGVAIAGASRAGFPTEIDHALMRVGGNQAALTLSAARQILELEESARVRERLLREVAEAARRKDEFLAILGHELRNPLAAIVAARRVRAGSPDDRRVPAIIDRQVATLTRLVDDLLDVSRISTGKIVLKRGVVDLNEVAERVRVACEHAAAERRHRLTLAVVPEPAWVDGDTVRLEQVITNLAHNAIKYTPPGGDIEIRVRREAEHVLVDVEDDGCGIPPEMIDRVFEPFVQVDSSIDRAQGGLGVGLALVKGLVVLHGGSVEARSEGIGRGCIMTVRLPLANRAAASPADTAALSRVPARPRRVLVVDDNVDVADMLKALLELDGHEVAVANDGHAGLDLAARLLPEIAFIDIGLPGIDGFEVARRIRSEQGLDGAYLVALSGYALDEDRRRALASGFNCHLAKPIREEDLARVLAECGRDGIAPPSVVAPASS
ncbi:MAG TPA: hybrid sensor histidine kinase/response regulator [Minicystis sp.]|nr:hybrid sensor histidine kinase/response regulator [Minicystis sp.]